MRAPTALALLTLVAAKSDGTPLEKALAGRVAGPPVACIDSHVADGPQVIDNRTLLYRSAGKVWRNDLPDACPSLDDDSILIVEMFGSRLCRNDHFRTVERGTSIPGAICRFGDFTPYSKAKPPKP